MEMGFILQLLMAMRHLPPDASLPRIGFNFPLSLVQDNDASPCSLCLVAQGYTLYRDTQLQVSLAKFRLACINLSSTSAEGAASCKPLNDGVAFSSLCYK